SGPDRFLGHRPELRGLIVLVETYSVTQLSERCREEAARFQRSGHSDPAFCFELFRRALTLHHDPAWSALVRQYEALVSRWAHEFGAADLDEEVTAFVNQAFARMWQYGCKAETAAKLDTLSKCLSYLKKCVWSAVEDHRQRRRHEIFVDDWQRLEPDLPPNAGPEGQLFSKRLRETVRQLLEETVQDEQERVAATMLWVYDLKPREVHSENPTLFASAAEVSQIRKNILKRLKRKLSEVVVEELM
ncbi:MAG: sigma-70 family RNA polymerase sigma factor, partial [Anaerolineae bacterium]|nr:sigma-70 family RNA polymerase sigma factor [Anaerolineae bacterium]